MLKIQMLAASYQALYQRPICRNIKMHRFRRIGGIQMVIEMVKMLRHCDFVSWRPRIKRQIRVATVVMRHAPRQRAAAFAREIAQAKLMTGKFFGHRFGGAQHHVVHFVCGVVGLAIDNFR